jgi:hypothetical protein
MAAAADSRLLDLFDARQVGGVVSDGVDTARGGLGVDQETYFMDPAAAQERAAQAGGRRRRRMTRRRQRGGRRNGNRKPTLKFNLRAQIRLRSRSQRRH